MGAHTRVGDVAANIAAYALAAIPAPAPTPGPTDAADPVAAWWTNRHLPRETATTEADAERRRDNLDREPLDQWDASRVADRYERAMGW